MKDVASPLPMTSLNVDGIGSMLSILLFCHFNPEFSEVPLGTGVFICLAT